MEATLILIAISLSVFFSVILKKYKIGLFFALLASNRMTHVNGTEIVDICVGIPLATLCFLLIIQEKKHKVFWLAVSLSVCYAIVIFYVRPYEIRIQYFIAYFVALLMFICTLLIKWNRESIIKFISAYGAYIIVFGFLEKIFINSVRISGPLTVATAYAVVLSIVWTIWFVEGILNSKQSMMFILFGSFLTLLAILFSGTRMGLLGLALGIAFGALFKVLTWHKSVLRKILTICGLFCVISLLFFIVWHFIPENMLIKKNFASLMAGRLDESNMGRIQIWLASFKIIPEHTLWGIGPGNFLLEFKKYLSLSNMPMLIKNAPPHAHNIFLIPLTEHGISGFIVFGIFALSCIASLLHKIFKYPNDYAYCGLLGGILIMIILGMADATPFYLPTICFGAWLMGVSAGERS